MKIIEWTIYSMIIFVVGDYFYTNPVFNAQYIVKLLVALCLYSITWTVYFTYRG